MASARTDVQSASRVAQVTLKIGEVRARWAWPALAALSTATFAGLTYLTSYKNFFYDEWDFINAYRPGQTSTSILFPHGEHWSTIPILIWKALFVLFGIRTHLPYQAIVTAAHVACVLIIFALIRRRSGDLPAFAAALVLLVLGTGSKEIVLAFQGNQTLSLALGLLALLMVEAAPKIGLRLRVVVVSLLLLGSLMSSGLGLGFVVAIALQVLLERTRRPLLLAVAAPAVIYLVWFVTNGSIGSPCQGCPSAMGDIRSIGPAFLVDVARFIAVGLAASVTGLIGIVEDQLPLVVIQAAVVIFAGVLAWHWYAQGNAEPWEIGLVAGLVAQFGLIALARAHFSVQGAADSRYVYVGVIYLLPLIANALKHAPWNFALRPIWAGAVTLVVLSNGSILAEQALSQQPLMQTENAELRVIELFRGAPDMAVDRPLDQEIMPQLTAAQYYAAIDELGSPVPSSTPKVLEKLSARAVDQQMVAVFGQALAVAPDTQRSALSPCHTVNSAGGLTLDTQVSEGEAVMLVAGQSGDASLSLGMFDPPGSQAVIKTHLSQEVPERLSMPRTGKPVIWRLRVITTPSGGLQICGVSDIRAHSGVAVFSAEAAGAGLNTGWESAPDPAAFNDQAARLPAGTTTRTWRDAFIGTPTVVDPGSYDVWYRVRVADTSGASPEMNLGVFDLTAYVWLGETEYKANEFATSYRWVKAASAVTQSHRDQLVFVAEFNSHARPLSTDWFVDEAMAVPAGSPAPADLA